MNSKELIDYCMDSYRGLERPEPIDDLPGSTGNSPPMKGFEAEVYREIAHMIREADRLSEIAKETEFKASMVPPELWISLETSFRNWKIATYCDVSHELLAPGLEAEPYRHLAEKIKAAKILFVSCRSSYSKKVISYAIRSYDRD
ncbi:MAG: hypothetical protein EOP06_10500 [Proteobacteria bacterium]|nr:MAG: hypothetical protein EOP06_10500 [Pseudomonadota bacterium]